MQKSNCILVSSELLNGLEMKHFFYSIAIRLIQDTQDIKNSVDSA